MLRLKRRPELQKPRFRGDVVTVCIGVVSQSLNQIAIVFDALISGPGVSAEGVSKSDLLTHVGPWCVMYAGEAHRFRSLQKRIADALPQLHQIHQIPLTEPKRTIAIPSLQQVVKACEDAYKVELLKRQEVEILLPYGLTLQDFIDTGLSKFGERKFTELLSKIENSVLGVSLLVVGFDEEKRPHIFELSEAGVISNFDHIGFHAIGEGQAIALGTLYPKTNVRYLLDESYLVYYACSAKFAAENAPSVGDETTCVVIGPPPRMYFNIFPKTLAELKTIWTNEGQPPVPATALALIAATKKAQG
jgi:proteasome subunit B (beta)-like protein